LTDNIPPSKEKRSQPRQHNNKDWHWCCPETGGKCDGKWTVHHPKQCKGQSRGKGWNKWQRGKDDDGKKPKKVKIKEAIVELEGAYESDSE